MLTHYCQMARDIPLGRLRGRRQGAAARGTRFTGKLASCAARGGAGGLQLTVSDLSLSGRRPSEHLRTAGTACTDCTGSLH